MPAGYPEEFWDSIGYTEYFPGGPSMRRHFPVSPPDPIPYPCGLAGGELDMQPDPPVTIGPDECESFTPEEPVCPGGEDGGSGSPPIPLDEKSMSRAPPAMEQVTTGHGRYYEAAGERLPSITTVLREYAGPNAGLAAWEERVGAERAREVREYASAVGDLSHAGVESWLLRGEEPVVDGSKMSIAVGSHVSRITRLLRDRCARVLAVERRVRHPLGMAGTVDLVCEWATAGGKMLAVVDFKTKGPKGMHAAALDGYFLQCALYAQAWKAEFGSTPNHLVVVESAEGAEGAVAHEAKAWPHKGTLPSGYAKAVDTGEFIQAFLRAREECKKW